MRWFRGSKCLLLLLLGLAVPAAAAFAEPMRELPIRCSGAFFALSVADLAASSRWYQEKLGLEVELEVPPQNGMAVTVLGGGGLVVELVQDDGARPPGPGGEQKVHGFYKAGVLVKQFDKTLEALRARGVEVAFGPFPATATQRANVILRDNAGNLIQMLAD